MMWIFEKMIASSSSNQYTPGRTRQTPSQQKWAQHYWPKEWETTAITTVDWFRQSLHRRPPYWERNPGKSENEQENKRVGSEMDVSNMIVHLNEKWNTMSADRSRRSLNGRRPCWATSCRLISIHRNESTGRARVLAVHQTLLGASRGFLPWLSHVVSLFDWQSAGTPTGPEAAQSRPVLHRRSLRLTLPIQHAPYSKFSNSFHFPLT